MPAGPPHGRRRAASQSFAAAPPAFAGAGCGTWGNGDCGTSCRRSGCAAILAALDMAPEGSRAAVLDSRHHLELAEAHTPGIGSAPSAPMVMKAVRDLQLRAAHRRLARPVVSVPPGKGTRAGRVG